MRHAIWGESTGLPGGREQNGDIKAHMILQFVIILPDQDNDLPDQDNAQSAKNARKANYKKENYALIQVKAQKDSR